MLFFKNPWRTGVSFGIASTAHARAYVQICERLEIPEKIEDLPGTSPNLQILARCDSDDLKMFATGPVSLPVPQVKQLFLHRREPKKTNGRECSKATSRV